MFTTNIEEFRREALYFKRYGRYDDGEFGSPYWNDWWDEQERRSLYGYQVGDMRISGYFYFYLNFCPIWLVRKSDYGTVTKNKPTNARKAGKRVHTFPDFWDEDFRFFTSLDIAEHGMTLDDYKKLPVDLELVEDPDNFSGGHHMSWLKPRGVGASYKGGSLPARNYFCIRGSKSYCYAHEKEYLNKDGIITKFLDYRDFINEHASGLAKHHDFKNDNTAMHYRASYDDGSNKEKGYKSEVIGVTFKDNTDKARGKRGKVIVIEESGMFPGLLEVLKKGRPSVEEADFNFGTIVAFGTGGSRKENAKNSTVNKEANLEGLRAMTYNPAQHNMLRFKNMYDPGMEGTEIGMFTTSTKNPQYKDENGNSIQEPVKKLRLKDRELASKSQDPIDLILEMAENPFCPQEALLESRSNPFTSEGLLAHRNYIQATGKYRSMGVKGDMVWIGTPRDQKVTFRRDDTLKPVYTYPHSRQEDNSGCIILYEEPYKVKDKIPPHLYTVNVDAYRFDETTGASLGAVYVLKSPNNFTKDRGNIIAASYIGRPPGQNGQEEFNHRIFQLSCYYNARIAFENDEPGDIIGYAKRNKMIPRLEEEFQMAYDDTLRSPGSKTRKFGVRMSAGRDNPRIKQGNVFFKKWLYQIRFVDSNGKEYCNYHTIPDLGLLQELCQYNLDGNFDRISAMRVAMYYQQELLYEELLPQKPRKEVNTDSIYNTRLYSDDSYSSEAPHPCIAER